jgi:hypothetical protein
LSALVPGADFSPYFAFVESLPAVETGHRHHILPRKEFPEFAKDPGNIARLSPTDHLKAHYWLAVCAPVYEPFQLVFYLMANRKRAYQVSVNELLECAEVYERGRVRQLEQVRSRCKVFESELVGRRFGRLAVVALNGRGIHRDSAWLCRCDCGAEKTIDRRRLMSGDAKSCGCSRSGSLVGQRFGRMTVSSRHPDNGSYGHTRWVAKCDCGTEKPVLGASLLSGVTKSCGCLRQENTANLAKVRAARAS